MGGTEDDEDASASNGVPVCEVMALEQEDDRPGERTSLSSFMWSRLCEVGCGPEVGCFSRDGLVESVVWSGVVVYGRMV